VTISVSLGQKHKPAFTASPCGANRDNDSLVIVQAHHPAKECSYALKHPAAPYQKTISIYVSLQ
jgi:hypothetical protein